MVYTVLKCLGRGLRALRLYTTYVTVVRSTYTPFTLSVNAISQQLGRALDLDALLGVCWTKDKYLSVRSFEIPKDKGFSEVRTAKLDPPRQRPGDRPRVQNMPGGESKRSP